MNPSRELPSYMNSSSTNMLQIPSKMGGLNSKILQITLKQQLPAPKCYTFHQNVANCMENERFQLQNVAKTVEMAASSSKMLQIARKTGRKNGSNKIPRRTNSNSQNNSEPLILIISYNARCSKVLFSRKTSDVPSRSCGRAYCGQTERFGSPPGAFAAGPGESL